ncbi:hypothetical protein Tco_1020007 [Tanacetum coccineum]|uniref:Uncharacterized protein n=1 Tax=Tanacetum coccineum TaxID=301880 RepID=A0ABQ5G112_9ASTR
MAMQEAECVANSTTEAEYIAASNCCGQVLWIQNQMLDYGYNFMYTKIYIDNKSTICIVKNLVFHSKTKHIEIRHHFIKDSNEKKLIQMIKIHTDHNVADLLTKAFDLFFEKKLELDSLNIDYDQEEENQMKNGSHWDQATKISESSGPIPLVIDETIIKEREDIMERAATTAFSLEAEQNSGSGPRCQDTILRDAEAQIRVLDFETTKTAQAKEIANLKKRVNKLEKRKRSRTPGMNLFKIGTSRRRILDEEDASKQGRNLKQGKQSSIFEESDFDDEGFDADMDEVFKDVEGDAEQVINAAADEVPTDDAINTAGTEVNTASAPVTTAGVSISTAEPVTPPTTTTIFKDEDVIISQTLMKIKSEKSNVRGVVMQESSKTATRPTVPPQQHDPKDKGMGKIVEQEKPLKIKDQIKFDEKITQRLQAQMQAELEEEERLVEMDIQEKDKNRSQNDKTEHKNGKSVKEKSSQSQKSTKKSKSTPGSGFGKSIEN